MKRATDPEEFRAEAMGTEEDRLCSLHHKWLKELFVAIRGNGDVKHSLEFKVQTLLDNQATIVKLVWIIAIAVIGKIIASPLWEVAVRHLSKG